MVVKKEFLQDLDSGLTLETDWEVDFFSMHFLWESGATACEFHLSTADCKWLVSELQRWIKAQKTIKVSNGEKTN